jgi:hypothetical protein
MQAGLRDLLALFEVRGTGWQWVWAFKRGHDRAGDGACPHHGWGMPVPGMAHARTGDGACSHRGWRMQGRAPTVADERLTPSSNGLQGCQLEAAWARAQTGRGGGQRGQGVSDSARRGQPPPALLIQHRPKPPPPRACYSQHLPLACAGYYSQPSPPSQHLPPPPPQIPLPAAGCRLLGPRTCGCRVPWQRSHCGCSCGWPCRQRAP